jgi:hypothetical protein
LKTKGVEKFVVSNQEPSILLSTQHESKQSRRDNPK